MKYIFKLSKVLTNLVRQWKMVSTSGVVVVLFCVIAYNFSNPIYAQSGKGPTKQQKDEVMLKMNGMFLSFLFSVETRYEQNQQQLTYLQTELQKHQAKEKKKKNQAADAKTEQDLREQINILSDRKLRYERMKTETEMLLAAMEENNPGLKEQNNLARIEQKRKQSGETVYRTDREKRIKEMELEAARLKVLIAQAEQKKNLANNQSSTSSDRERIVKMKREADDLKNLITIEKQKQQTAYLPEREQRIMEMEKEAAKLMDDIKIMEQKQLAQSSSSNYSGKDSKTIEKNISDLTSQIDKQKREQQIAYLPEREQQIKKLEKERDALKTEYKKVEQKQWADNRYSPTSGKDPKVLERNIADITNQINQQKKEQQVSYLSEREKQIQKLEREREALKVEYKQAVEQQNRYLATNSTKQNQKTSSKATPLSQRAYTPGSHNTNVTSGYYIIFGSFIIRENADRFLSKLEREYSNVVDIGNENIFGMYRTGIGPYSTKSDALSKRPNPADVKNWILRIDFDNYTGAIVYFEMYYD